MAAEKKAKEQKTMAAACLLNVRKEPSLEAEIVRVMQKGERVSVLDVTDGWVHMKDGYSMAAYMTK